MTKTDRISPTSERIKVAEGSDIVSFLRNTETESIAITVDIDAVKGLVVAGSITFTPETVAGAGVVHTTAGFKSGNNRFLGGVYQSKGLSRSSAHDRVVYRPSARSVRMQAAYDEPSC